MIKLFLILLFTVFPTICFSDYQWKLITKSKNGDFYVDMETLTIEGNKRFYLRLRDYKEIDEYGERSNIIYFETDCDSYESRFLTDIYFEDHMGKGKSKILNEVGDWIIPKDGSVGQNFIKVVCSLKK